MAVPVALDGIWVDPIAFPPSPGLMTGQQADSIHDGTQYAHTLWPSKELPTTKLESWQRTQSVGSGSTALQSADDRGAQEQSVTSHR